MHIVVTGSAGAIGSHMAEALKEKGHTVTGIDAFTGYYDPAEKRRTAAELLAKGIKTKEVDLTDEDEYLPSDTEFIFHFAAQPGISASVPFSEYEKNNVTATARLAERAMKLPNLKGFILVSTSSVYGVQAVGNEKAEPRPASHYGVTKLASEQLILSYARQGLLPAASARLFSVYGERERPEKLFRKLIAAIDSETPFSLYEGSREHRRSFTYVKDVTDGLLRMLERWEKCHGEIFNLGSVETHTTGEGIELVEKLMGKKGKYINVPARAGEQLETSADISKAQKILGYAPTTSLEEGLRHEIEWCRTIHNK